jgi:predicted ferric reductase
MNRLISGSFWIALYLLVVLAPVFLMLVRPVPSGRSFWFEFSIALGFVGLTQIAVQFVLIARFKRVTAPYGVDLILQYHRQIAIIAVALILLHPTIILIDNPSRLELLNPLGGTLASRFGLASIASLVAIVLLSLFRQQLRLGYETWRVTHALLAVTALICAQVHVSLAGLYINTAWKQALWIVSSALMVSLVLYLRLVKPALMRRRPYRVAQVAEERGDTVRLVLEPDGHQGFRFQPGQFAWIKVAESPYSLQEHPFSFAGSAEAAPKLEFGIKKLGDWTKRSDALPVGARAYVDGPHGSFSVDRYGAPAYVFIAGGIGITPFMSMLRTMADRGDKRPVLLLYGNKDWETLTYREELDELAERLELRVVYVLEEPTEERETEEGFIDAALLKRQLPKDKLARTFFICGPDVMMDAVTDALREVGVPQARIHLERFNLV